MSNLFKLNNRDTTKASMTSSGVFIVNLADFTICSGASIVDFEQENACWGRSFYLVTSF